MLDHVGDAVMLQIFIARTYGSPKADGDGMDGLDAIGDDAQAIV